MKRDILGLYFIVLLLRIPIVITINDVKTRIANFINYQYLNGPRRAISVVRHGKTRELWHCEKCRQDMIIYLS